MKRMGGIVLATIAVAAWSLTVFSNVSAISSSLVIAQIQLGAAGASKQEFVQLHNNADTEVDVTEWCVTYSDYKDESRTTLICFVKPTDADELRVPAHGNILVASQSYVLPDGVSTSERFVGSSTDMSGARGHVRLMNAHGEEVDKVAWDNKASTPPASPEGAAATAPVAGKAIMRAGTAVLVDTDDNSADLHEQISMPLSSDLFEYSTPKQVVDLCQMDGIQETMPDGYGYDEAGNCELLSDDLCTNIDKVQTVYPEGMLADELGNCFSDTCSNIGGLQESLPEGYRQENGTCTKLEDRPLLLSELLPNASGTDTGQEFIEIFNPNDTDVLLDGYTFQIGKQFEKSYALVPVRSTEMIAPHAYRIFSDDALGFTLLNTNSGVRLITPAGTNVSQTIYTNPKDDVAWAYIGIGWEYTNQPTPAALNTPSSAPTEDHGVLLAAEVTPAPCAPGKYRNPLTNRCRNIESDAAVLASCDADEYRNPETNRCRKVAVLAAATLSPCAEGYERNPETNRCRKVAAAVSTLKPCQEGYERNPETNRCRVVSSAAQGKTASVVPASNDDQSVNWLAVGGISMVTFGYALYEWRTEIGKGLKTAAAFVKR